MPAEHNREPPRIDESGERESDVFISYASPDKALAEDVCQWLESGGFSCWIASRDVPPGARWADAMISKGALTRARVVVRILSSNIRASEQAEHDFKYAVKRRIPVISFALEGVSRSYVLADSISGAKVVAASDPPSEEQFALLLQRVQKALVQPDPAKRWEHIKRPVTMPVPAPPLATHADYDVFISYRREGGSDVARLIRSELRQRHLRAFLDVEDLRAGHFDQALLDCIARTPNFVLILTPHSLDRCAHVGDWFRREIVQAVSTNRRIIPVLMPGFIFPAVETLPEDMRSLHTHQSVGYSHEYFSAVIDRLERYLLNR